MWSVSSRSCPSPRCGSGCAKLGRGRISARQCLLSGQCRPSAKLSPYSLVTDADISAGQRHPVAPPAGGYRPLSIAPVNRGPLRLEVAQFVFGTKTFAGNYLTSSDRQLVVQPPRAQSPVGQYVPSRCRAVQKARPCFFVCAFFYWNRLGSYSFCPYERARYHPNIRIGLVRHNVVYARTQRHCRIGSAVGGLVVKRSSLPFSSFSPFARLAVDASDRPVSRALEIRGTPCRGLACRRSQ